MSSSFDPINVFIFLSGAAFLLKKVADMDRYHELRVWLITMTLSTIVIVLFVMYCFPPTYSCVLDVDVDDGFTLSY